MTALPQVNAQGATQFEALGWPTKRSEEWRYFRVRDLRTGGFEPAGSGSPTDSVDAGSIPAQMGTTTQVVVVNGRLDRALSTGLDTATGLQISSLGEDIAAGAEHTARHLMASGALAEQASMPALNAQHFVDGVCIVAADGAVCEPIEVVFVTAPGSDNTAAPALTSPRVFVRAGRHAHVQVVLRFVSGGADAATLTNALVHVVATDGAQVRAATLCDESDASMHIHTVLAEVGRDAHFASHVLMNAGNAARSEIRVKLAEQGASCNLRGLYVADGKQVLDNYTLVEHIAPHTTSNQFYRGIIDGGATGTFQGRVLIHEGAIRSEAHQLNNNLLLGDNATVNAKPQLEIDNDDVVASHGSTVGQLDDDALFYLQSRGLTPIRARGLLTYAFASQVLDGMPCPERAADLARKLEHEFSGATDHATWPSEL